MKYALLSVFDKTGIVDLARELVELGYTIISTGGTSKLLAENSIPHIPPKEITGDPESFDGRMKTISFEIESGILFDRTNPEHVKQAKELGIKPIDIVVCNLYPFEQTISKPDVKLETAIENIDVGGPTMVRSAAKNCKNVYVVVDVKDYSNLIEKLSLLSKGGDVSAGCASGMPRKQTDDISPNTRDRASQLNNITQALEHDSSFTFRKSLAAKAFAHLSFYDSQIAKYLSNDLFPEEITIPGRKALTLRYGENAHQQAAVYLLPNHNSPFTDIKQHAGRELSMVNITDIAAGIESVKLFDEPAAVVIKHNTPCGIALGKNSTEALQRALDADPESAFGGVVVTNTKWDEGTSKVIAGFKEAGRGNMDIVAAPEMEAQAVEMLKKVRKTTGIYTFGKLSKPKTEDMNVKWIDGGFVYQTMDADIDESFTAWEVVTKLKPTKQQLKQMQIAWKFISRIKSNTIIIMDEKLPMTRGIGSGQTSRIRSAKIALEQAGKYADGSILASDSFFPFDDTVRLAAKAGIKAIVQQGGSINDKLSIQAADELGIAMVMTKRRAFWH